MDYGWNSRYLYTHERNWHEVARVCVLFQSVLRQFQTEFYLAATHIMVRGDAAVNYEQYTETKGMFCPYSSEPIVPSNKRLIAAGPTLPGFTLSFVPLKLPSLADAK